jgi:hypothetical protein
VEGLNAAVSATLLHRISFWRCWVPDDPDDARSPRCHFASVASNEVMSCCLVRVRNVRVALTGVTAMSEVSWVLAS